MKITLYHTLNARYFVFSSYVIELDTGMSVEKYEYCVHPSVSVNF